MSRQAPSATRVRITIGTKSIEATLADSEAARDFASLLPITLPMNGLFRREKFAHLPRAISEQGKRTHDYAVGTIGYWPPGPDVAIFYRQDGERIPDPGLIVLGKIKAGVEALNVPGAIRATIELS
ncbi:MAG TPA: cyclophilin-like fold protein [Mesorhizobium sp.]|nr:cyclophilin-like fold protein [Mesorhizobium sp.]